MIDSSSPGSWLHGFGLALAISTLAVAAGLGALRAKGEGPVVAIFNPLAGSGAALAAVTRAQGGVLGFGRRDWIVFVAGTSATFHDDLLREGAWLLLDPAKASGLCAPPS